MNTYPSENLKYLVEITNLVSHQRNFECLSEILNNIRREITALEIADEKLNSFGYKRLIYWIKTETKKSSDLMNQISKIIRKMDYMPANGLYFVHRYDFFWRTREIVWYYAGGEGARIDAFVVGHPVVLIRKKDSTDNFIESLDSMLFQKSYFPTLSIELTDGVDFNFFRDIIEPALINIDLDRLRICQICERVFWAFRAFRKEPYGCSDKYNNVRRVRKFRKREKDNLDRRSASRVKETNERIARLNDSE